MPNYELDYKNCKIKYYPNGSSKLIVFNDNVYNSRPEFRKKRGNYKMSSTTEKESNIRATKEKIFDIAYANIDKWEYFVTLTLNEEVISRTDTKEISRRVNKWFYNSVSRKNCHFLLIPEYHKDQKSIHFHGLISGDFNFIDSGHKDKSNRIIYNLTDYKFGFTTAVKLDTDKSPIAVCKYITKYCTKDTQKIFGSRYLAGGRDLKRELPTLKTFFDFGMLDAEEISIPNSNRKIKYAFIGVVE